MKWLSLRRYSLSKKQTLSQDSKTLNEIYNLNLLITKILTKSNYYGNKNKHYSSSEEITGLSGSKSSILDCFNPIRIASVTREYI